MSQTIEAQRPHPRGVVVMPAYNAARTLERTVADIPPGSVDEIILRRHLVMVHPDYQYDARLIPFMTGSSRRAACDVILGNRIRGRREALAGGMPRYKYVANRLLTVIENLGTGQSLGEWHSHSNDFVFDCQFLLSAASPGFRLGAIPAPARHFAEASSIDFRRSVRYGIASLYHLAQTMTRPAPDARTRRG